MQFQLKAEHRFSFITLCQNKVFMGKDHSSLEEYQCLFSHFTASDTMVLTD